MLKMAASAVWLYICLGTIAPAILKESYKIRLNSIDEYGKFDVVSHRLIKSPRIIHYIEN